MHREREHLRDVLENRRSAVALMHVQIDDHSALNTSLLAQLRNGHGNIVHHAESFGVIGERMVGAAGKVRGDPFAERDACREQRSAGGEPRAQPQCIRPRQAESPLFRARQSRPIELGEVLARVDERERIEIDGFRNQKVAAGDEPFPKHDFLQNLGFGNREGMAGRQGDGVAGVIDALH
jgi:hypothetical protein